MEKQNLLDIIECHDFIVKSNGKKYAVTDIICKHFFNFWGKRKDTKIVKCVELVYPDTTISEASNNENESEGE